MSNIEYYQVHIDTDAGISEHPGNAPLGIYSEKMKTLNSERWICANTNPERWIYVLCVICVLIATLFIIANT